MTVGTKKESRSLTKMSKKLMDSPSTPPWRDERRVEGCGGGEGKEEETFCLRVRTASSTLKAGPPKAPSL
jgi:hypothetical protein